MSEITDLDRRLAKMCTSCPACRHARKKHKGIIHWFVTKVENRVCPACRAYEKVYGKKASGQ